MEAKSITIRKTYFIIGTVDGHEWYNHENGIVEDPYCAYKYDDRFVAAKAMNNLKKNSKLFVDKEIGIFFYNEHILIMRVPSTYISDTTNKEKDK